MGDSPELADRSARIILASALFLSPALRARRVTAESVPYLVEALNVVGLGGDHGQRASNSRQNTG
jgi:hypothetical protein